MMRSVCLGHVYINNSAKDVSAEHEGPRENFLNIISRPFLKSSEAFRKLRPTVLNVLQYVDWPLQQFTIEC